MSATNRLKTGSSYLGRASLVECNLSLLKTLKSSTAHDYNMRQLCTALLFRESRHFSFNFDIRGTLELANVSSEAQRCSTTLVGSSTVIAEYFITIKSFLSQASLFPVYAIVSQKKRQRNANGVPLRRASFCPDAMQVQLLK